MAGWLLLNSSAATPNPGTGATITRYGLFVRFMCETICSRTIISWQGVEFPISPLTCVVALTTLSHYRVSVWFGMR